MLKIMRSENKIIVQKKSIKVLKRKKMVENKIKVQSKKWMFIKKKNMVVQQN